MKYTTHNETIAYMAKSDAAIKTVREEVWNQFNGEPGEASVKMTGGNWAHQSVPFWTI